MRKIQNFQAALVIEQEYFESQNFAARGSRIYILQGFIIIPVTLLPAMSSNYYNNLWKEAINELLENIHEQFEPLDQNLHQKGLKYERTDPQWFRFYAHLYVKYVHCYRVLQDCYDQLVHPQKRVLLRDMLESTALRVVEIKLNLIRYNTATNSVRSQYVNLDEFLLELRVGPAQIQMNIPRYYVDDTNPDKAKRNQIVEKFLLDLKQTNLPQQQVIQERTALDTNMETAIRIIQKIERGRQGIVRALKAAYFQKRQLKKLAKKRQGLATQNFDFDDDGQKQREQVTLIQKTIKGFMARRLTEKLRQEQLAFLGIIKKPQDPNDPSSAVYKMNKHREKMKDIQKQNEKEYQQTLKSLKDDLMEKWQEPIKEKMLRDRRLWISEFLERNEFTKIPNFAKEFYIKDKVKIPPSPEQQEMMAKLAEQKKKEKKGKKKKKKLTEKDKFQKDNPRCGPTQAVMALQQNIEQHTEEWGNQTGPEDKPQMQKVKQTVLPEVEGQIQKMVDDMIELELANLRIKMKKKRDKKKKKIEVQQQQQKWIRNKDRLKPKKKKKKKKTKPLKVPGWKDISKIPPLDQIGHLVDFGVLKKLMPARVKDLFGQPNLLRTKEEISSQLMPDPSYFDVRQTLVELIGIPLGSKYIKERVDKLHYFLFFGPHGAGKTLMVRALATECDALLLELSPYTLEQKINDKKELNKMIAMTFNVAKTFSPAIIYMDEAEQIFKGKKKKKKGAGGAAGPNFTKLRKTLTKYKKKVLKKEDRVAVIATTNKPWEMNKKFIKSFTHRRFYFPFPNYSTRKALFEHFMEEKNVKLPDDFPITTIAHVTEGYTGGNFKEAINKVVSERRIMQIRDKMSSRPLSVNEFIGPLANQPSTYIEEYEKFREFNDDVTGIKLRRDRKNKPQEPEKKK